MKPYSVPRRIFSPRLDSIAENIDILPANIDINNHIIMPDLNIVTNRDLITEARSVPVFRGTDTFELSHFITEVETITGLAQEANLRNYLTNILLTKIQGPAAQSIRRLGTATWEQIKTQLKRSFGVQQSYLKLKEEADAVKYVNVSQYYKELIQCLDKLNLKYQLDDTKPEEFSAANNEKSILEKFLNKLPRNDSMYLRIKNVQSVEEAYFELIETGTLASSTPNKNNHHNNMNFNGSHPNT